MNPVKRRMNPWTIAALVFGLLFGATYLRYALWPAIEVVVPLLIGGARVHVQGWAGLLDDGPEILVIETSTGSLEADLGIDWGVGPRVLLYRTPQNRLGILRDGATFEAVANVSKASGPVFEPTQDLDSEGWTYLGAIVLKHIDGPRFVPPSELEECYAPLGARSSPIRKKFQVQRDCAGTRPSAR
ncbi:hypothetical protein [Methylobacterium sp. DB0501]|uniref:hypothetical protein n=2 Tax=Methylobacterium TaxID=407 RepID=UPI0013ECB79F|nr:hypothetical protein [Methylobacterium sp. DB0501]